MATPSRIGTITIRVDGAWDIEDLLSLSEGLSESYGLFYPLVAKDDDVRDRLHDLLRRQFWTGDIQSRHFGRHVYRAVPDEEGLKLKSFVYHSPGAMEIVGVLAVLLMLARVAHSWIAVGDEFVTLLEKINKFFKTKRLDRRPKAEFELTDEMVSNSDEARALVFEIGGKLGFDAISCERLISVLGNPISALKYLVAAGNEGRKLAELQLAGLLQLPAPPEGTVTIAEGAAVKRKITVVRKRPRRPKPSQTKA